MLKTWLIIEREYLTRVKKKSFILITLLAPLLLVGGLSLIIWLGIEEDSTHNVLIIDEKAPAFKGISDKKNIKFNFPIA